MLEDGFSNSDRKTRLKGLCNSAAALHVFLVFVVDQANALDDALVGQDRFSNEVKVCARNLLDEITARHIKFASSTANYVHG